MVCCFLELKGTMKLARIIIPVLYMLPLLTFAQERTLFPIDEALDYLESIPEPSQFMPVPQAADTFWRQAIPPEVRAGYISNARKAKGKRWEAVPDSLFAEFKTIGNRKNYENKNFGLRRQLANLVMGEIMEHEGRFLPDIVAGLHYFQEEVWWGLPAHYPLDHPEADNQLVDIFNAETAGMLAWAIYMLRDELEAVEAGLCEAVRHEIDRRVLTPIRKADYWWKKTNSNWNAWTCENWLACVLMCEDDHQRQMEDVEEILGCMKMFYDRYPDDGGCDEGVTYWNRAAASFFVCAYLLDMATDHQFSLADDPKLKALASFVYKMYIGNRSYVNFADAAAYPFASIEILFPFGAYIGDTDMTGYAAFLAQSINFAAQFGQGGFPCLSRELLFLSQYDAFKEIQASEPLLQDVWLENIQVMAARTDEGTTKGLFVAVKGGHNRESHNHNDVGNFIVYGDANPLIVDIGAGTYTAETFGDRRYELMNCRSAYHNVPLINGVEQHFGRQYQASEVEYSQENWCTTLSMNLSGAYPEEAHVIRWLRTIEMDRDRGLKITEDYVLDRYLQPTEIVLVCCGEARQNGSGDIVIGEGGKHHVRYDDSQLTPVIEKLEITDMTINRAWNNKPLYRIRLVVGSKWLKGKISYSVM